ncbi:MAG: sigma-54 dependent transcriptional regulator [Nitrospirota bacterium]
MSIKGNILIVDDEKPQREILRLILEDEGYSVITTGGGNEALALIEKFPPELILSDLKMPDMNGLELLARLLKHNIPTIIMTAYGTISSAVEAMKMGAMDYLTKPLDRDELLISVKRVFEKIALQRENIILQHQLQEKFRIENIIGSHGLMQEVFKTIRKVSNTNSTVLIYGESGTGKELVARAIHYNSQRKDRPFMGINCAAIPDTLLESELFGYEAGAFTGAIGRKIGLFEASNKSTLFLDEIGDLSANMQAKILRVLQEKEIMRIGGRHQIKIDVRIIAATNKDIETEMKKGHFREDLFYRLNVITITLPPLRNRITDIPELVNHFIAKYRVTTQKEIKGITDEALRILMGYNWPGNVRQIESVIERAMIFSEGEMITPKDIPVEVRIPLKGTGRFIIDIPDEGISIEELERELILKAMEKSGWVITKAAKLLGLSFRTLQYRLEKFNINSGHQTIPKGA